MKKVFKVFLFLFLSFPVFGREKPVFPLSVEHIGRGNASLTTARDGKAIFFNPALISLAEDKIYLLDLGLGNSKMVNEIFQNPGVIEEKILQNDPPLGYIAFAGPLFAGFKSGNFQAVFFQSFSLDFDTYAILPPDPDFGAYGKISMTQDTGVAAGFSFLLPVQLAGSKWEYMYMGFSGKIFHRVKGSNSRIPFDEIAGMGDPLEFFQDKLGLSRAISFTSDAGLIYQYADFSMALTGYNLLSLPLFYKPTSIPAVWQSTSDTESGKTSLPVDFGFGMSYKIPQFSGIPPHFLKNLSFALDFQDLTNQDDYPELTQKIRFGVEATLARVIFIRAGVYHGMITFGVGYEIFIFKIDAAYWGEKIGSRNTLNWGMRIAMEF